VSLSVLILAGQREGIIDPLCQEAGVKHKAVIPIHGEPMIRYVLEALEAAGLKPLFYVSGFDPDYDERLTQAPSRGGPTSSALGALESGMAFPVLITTCDHPLLTPGMLEIFIRGAQKEGADFCAGVAEKKIIQHAYPDTKRTYLRFKDTSISGCNLFYIANEKGVEAVRLWQRAQQFRKQPLKLAMALGLDILLNYTTGSLTAKEMFARLGQKMGITAAPVFIPIPEAAIDVDTPVDKVLVEEILSK